MARAETHTLLSLDRFAAILGVHPLHFNQIVLPQLQPDNVCDEPILQYSWMAADKMGRDEIATYIAQAEDLLRINLGYPVAPSWFADETVIDGINTGVAPELFGNGLNLRGFNQGFRVNNGYLISGGIEAKSLVSAGAAIVYSDTNGDGFFETATITVATTVTDPEEIALYYPGTNADDAWEIRPITVSIAAGIATIVCGREQLLLAALQEGFSDEAARAVDGNDNTKFLITVDVYRHYNDPSQQATFVWEALGNWCTCDADDCPNCTLSAQGGCLTTRNPKLGYFSASPGAWDATTLSFSSDLFSECRAPDRVRVWYRAGFRDMKLTTPNVRMSPMWERAVTYLAASMLDRPLCSCKPLQAQIQRWRDDLAVVRTTQAATVNFRITDKVLNNPLGTTRGAIYAWELARKHMISGSAT